MPDVAVSGTEPNIRFGTGSTTSAVLNYASDAGLRGTYEIREMSRSTLSLRSEPAEVRDARLLNPASSLDREGFRLIRRATEVKDFYDDAEVARVYLPEIAQIVKELTGARKVYCQPNTVVRVTNKKEREDKQRADAAPFLHLDYSPKSALEFLAASAGTEFEAARMAKRIFVYNTWRTITPPPQSVPLAFCDKRSVSLGDYVTADAHYGTDDSGRGGITFEVTTLRYAPGHRWYYFSNMVHEELVIFKGWDMRSAPEPSVFHGAFKDPSCPASAPDRVSIEARAFALFDD